MSAQLRIPNQGALSKLHPTVVNRRRHGLGLVRNGVVGSLKECLNDKVSFRCADSEPWYPRTAPRTGPGSLKMSPSNRVAAANQRARSAADG